MDEQCLLIGGEGNGQLDLTGGIVLASSRPCRCSGIDRHCQYRNRRKARLPQYPEYRRRRRHGDAELQPQLRQLRFHPRRHPDRHARYHLRHNRRLRPHRPWHHHPHRRQRLLRRHHRYRRHLSVSRDANLGAGGTFTTLDGGTLRIPPLSIPAASLFSATTAAPSRPTPTSVSTPLFPAPVRSRRPATPPCSSPAKAPTKAAPP